MLTLNYRAIRPDCWLARQDLACVHSDYVTFDVLTDEAKAKVVTAGVAEFIMPWPRQNIVIVPPKKWNEAK